VDDDGVAPEIRCVPLAVVLVAGAGDAPLGAAEELLTDGDWLTSEGATSAADGGTATAPDGVADALVTTGTDGVADALVTTGTDGVAAAALLGASAVVVIGAGSLVDGATARGAGATALVDVGLTAVVGAVVVWTVTAGASDSCTGGGDGMVVGATGIVIGAFGGAAGGGISAGVGGISAAVVSSAFTLGAGTGTVVVVGATVSVFGLAYAGARPPVSAVKEMTTPDASTATTLRREQISSDAPTCVDSSIIPAAAAVARSCCPAQPSPPTLGLVQQVPRLVGAGGLPVTSPNTSADSSFVCALRYKSRCRVHHSGRMPQPSRVRQN
jgi:hypothetical protein